MLFIYIHSTFLPFAAALTHMATKQHPIVLANLFKEHFRVLSGWCSYAYYVFPYYRHCDLITGHWCTVRWLSGQIRPIRIETPSRQKIRPTCSRYGKPLAHTHSHSSRSRVSYVEAANRRGNNFIHFIGGNMRHAHATTHFNSNFFAILYSFVAPPQFRFCHCKRFQFHVCLCDGCATRVVFGSSQWQCIHTSNTGRRK